MSSKKSRPQVVADLLADVPRAKADLIAAGYSQKQLDTMPPAQIVLLHIVETYDQIRDDLFKWFHLPYLQAKEGLEAFERDLPSAKKRETPSNRVSHIAGIGEDAARVTFTSTANWPRCGASKPCGSTRSRIKASCRRLSTRSRKFRSAQSGHRKTLWVSLGGQNGRAGCRW